eukprot:TRINITY_DN3209_c0_g1_i1.p1 TRINITY_DN3209_c0_g1~~TRINITY_DN3209_c0_g1_i1.p1  ORF type:complete len:313 (-),score=95.30 TRINITY_DN3209_c0_g1_i1:62-961(-)
MRGGMGAISKALQMSAANYGAEIHTGQEVKQILVKDNVAQGIVLADGTTVKSKVVLSNATPHVTFLKLLDKSILPKEFVRRQEGYDYASGTFKINVALDKLPNFTCKPHSKDSSEASDHHRTTIHLIWHSDQIDKAFQDAAYGEPSREPVVEMTIPSSLDNTLAPAGKHVAGLFCQYAPYKLKDGRKWDESEKQKFVDNVFNMVEQYAPGFKSSVIGVDALSPVDLESVFGLTGGNIFHGAIGLNQLYFMRPGPGYSDYETPVKGLYLCGSGAHPGGGVMGAPGRNSSHLAIQKLQHRV